VLTPQLRDVLRTADEIEADIFGIIRHNENIPEDEEYVQHREMEGRCGELVGHMDLVRRYPRRCVTAIIDYKFGRIPAERAELSLQLRGYAVTCGDDTVYVAIAQPRAPRLERLTIAKYDQADLAQSRLQIQSILDRTKDPDAPLFPGEHCRYCKARGFCPALKEAVTNSLVPMGILSHELSKPKKLGIVEARLAGVSDEELSKMLDAYTLVQFIHEPMKDEARRRIEAGQLEGWKLGKAVERRKITDNPRAITLLVLAGMERTQIMDKCVNVSITKLEELLTKDGIKAKEFTNRVLESVIEIEVGRPWVLKK
jgi:hypothetical protein